MAAGVVLVREEGGVETRIDGSVFDLEEPNLLATNGSAIHQELVGLLS